MNLFLILFLYAQEGYMMIETPKETRTASSPAAKNREARKQSAISPEDLYARILATPDREWHKHSEDLGLAYCVPSKPGELQLIAINLDDDEDLERILIAKQYGGSSVHIFKKVKAQWWKLGAFCGQSSAELQPTVHYGTNDLTITSGGSTGIGVGVFTTSIYRVWQGSLYKVFSRNDGYNWSHETTSQMRYSTDPVAVRMTVTKTYTDAPGGKPHPKGVPKTASTCTALEWNATQFQFELGTVTRGACK